MKLFSLEVGYNSRYAEPDQFLPSGIPVAVLVDPISVHMPFLSPTVVIAGMPSPQLVLTELGKRRFEEVSFFLLVFLLGAVCFRWLWNSLQHDFPWWPRLSYRGTLGLLCVWGCLLTVVLSLISGARELMTPAAWTPSGITYKVASRNGPTAADAAQLRERESRLHSLRAVLLQYADQHSRKFPQTKEELASISAQFWIAVPEAQLKYIYDPAPNSSGHQSPLAIEPEFYDGGQLLLMKDGTVSLRKSVATESQEEKP